MEIDKSIAELAGKLDDWFDKNSATFGSQDLTAQGNALVAGIEVAKQLDRLTADGLAALQSLINPLDARSDDDRAAKLVGGFEFAAKLRATLHDELLDTDGCNKIVQLMNNIATKLDTGTGRAALAELLEHPDERVRASAGAYLLIVNLMPERVVPILR